MTANEYIDPKRFPRTTQKGLGVKDQLMIDAFNYDSLKEAIDHGKPLDDTQKARYAEFEEKARYRSALLAEIVAAEKAAKEKKEAELGAPDPRYYLTPEERDEAIREANRHLIANEEYRRERGGE